MRIRQDGFTLVEVLVVVIIAATLAAIGIAGYLGQRNRAYDAEAKSNLHIALRAARAYELDNGSYNGFDLHKNEPSLRQATSEEGSTMWTGAASASLPRDPRVVRVAVVSSGQCLSLGVRSRNKKGHFGVFDCRRPVTYLHTSELVPYEMSVGSFYGSSKVQLWEVESEALAELKSDFDND